MTTFTDSGTENLEQASKQGILTEFQTAEERATRKARRTTGPENALRLLTALLPFPGPPSGSFLPGLPESCHGFNISSKVQSCIFCHGTHMDEVVKNMKRYETTV